MTVVEPPEMSVLLETVAPFASPPVKDQPAPLVVGASTVSENVTTIVLRAVAAAVYVGAIPSEGVALPDVCGFPATSLTEPTSVTSGVSPVPMAVPKVKVTTPAESSDAALTVLLATVKSLAATVVPSRSSENVTSMRVVVTVAAESNVGAVVSASALRTTAAIASPVPPVVVAHVRV